MNDQKIDKLFNDIFDEEIPQLDESAKKSAINNATQEFSQAFSDSTRLIGNRDKPVSTFSQSIRRVFMSIINDKPTSNAFATAAIAFVGVSVYFALPNFQSQKIQTQGSGGQEIIANNKGDSKIIPIVPPEQVTAVVTGKTQNASTKPQADKEVEMVVGTKKYTEQVLETPIATGTRQILPEQKKKITNNKYKITDISAHDSQTTSLNVQQPQSDTPRTSKQQVSNYNSPVELEESIAAAPLSSLHSKRPTSRERVDLGSKKVRSYSDQITSPQQNRPDLGEEYANKEASSISFVQEKPVSTFSIDVDTASYSLVRNQLNRGYLPKTGAVRAEEMINYFDYNYPLPSSKKVPFKPSVNVINSPWNTGKKLIHIGIKGYDIAPSETPDSNLVFLLDVSGSMNSANKLPLVKQSINLLLETLKPTDTISMVVYAGAAGTVLEPTMVSEKSKILEAIKRLNAGGSTAGAQGIELAYQLAEQNFDKNAVNRIILATDGDFNVGLRNNQDLKTLVERKRDKGVFLSVLGFGRNNYQDDMMQTLAQNGNGVAAYIDTLSEAKKVLVDQATGTLFTIAKDVKIQMEFNPNAVSDYRLVGYETRALKREDFNNDKVDAGDIGAGHSVTAIYEITPTNSENPSIDPLRYADQQKAKPDAGLEYGFLKIRYKLPNNKKSKLIKQAIAASNTDINSDVQFSVAAAGFAQLLRNSNHTGDLDFDKVIRQAVQHKGEDPFGYRSEFIQLVRMAKIAK